jgi:hypothetical protein
VAQVALRGRKLACREMGQRGGETQPGVGRHGLPTDARQRTPQRPVVPGQDQPHCEPVQQVGEHGFVAAVQGVLEGS